MKGQVAESVCDLVIFTLSVEYFHSFNAGVDLNSYIIAVI